MVSLVNSNTHNIPSLRTSNLVVIRLYRQRMLLTANIFSNPANLHLNIGVCILKRNNRRLMGIQAPSRMQLSSPLSRVFVVSNCPITLAFMTNNWNISRVFETTKGTTTRWSLWLDFREDIFKSAIKPKIPLNKRLDVTRTYKLEW